ncbi:MAG TPA: hypothetical protein PLN21_21330 [Gemmatales bacterium]|nr:hypothetical protein [Gemmatales bacterium]
MPAPESRHEQIRRMRRTGLSSQTIYTTATQLWDLPPSEARKEQRKALSHLVMEATSFDILGELMLKYRQQEHTLDIMSRELRKDDLKASFFNTHRKLLKDSCNTLLVMHEMRDKTGRNHCIPIEEKAKRKKEQLEMADLHMRDAERMRQSGYFWDPRYGIMQPHCNLTSLTLAIRDVIRMRMLPKSPYEDYMIAQALDALTEEEKKLDPETLCKEERLTELQTWGALKDAKPGMTDYKHLSILTQRFFLERAKEYNRVWAQAESHVDGLMAAKGIKPHPDAHPVGIPPLVKRAAEGDEEAIRELKEWVARHSLVRPPALDEKPLFPHGPDWENALTRSLKQNIAAELNEPTPANVAESPPPDKNTQDSAFDMRCGRSPTVPLTPTEGLPATPSAPLPSLAKVATQVITILLAFLCAWMCLTLITVPSAMAIVMPLGITDVMIVEDAQTQNLIIHHPDIATTDECQSPSQLVATSFFLAAPGPSG